MLAASDDDRRAAESHILDSYLYESHWTFQYSLQLVDKLFATVCK